MNDKFYDIVLLVDETEVLFLKKNLGVLKIASELRKSGFSVFVLNHLHIFSINEIKLILQKVIGPNTLYVGVNPFFYRNTDNVSILKIKRNKTTGLQFGDKQPGSILPHGKKYNEEIAELIKSCNPTCKLVLGGPDAKDLSTFNIFDYIIIGYGDIAAVELAQHLQKSLPLHNSYKSLHGPRIINGDKAEAYNFVATTTDYSAEDGILLGETLHIEISRGCIFRCKFCSFPLNGKKKNEYIKYEEILYNEFLNNYEKFKVTRYIFVDDTFNDSIEKLNMILRISKRLPFQLEYWAYIRLDLLVAHPESIDILYDSGLRAAYFGIESMNQKTAESIGKGGNRKKLIDAIAYIKNKFGNNLMTNGSFIFGLPHETLDSMKETARQLVNKEIKLDSWFIYPLKIQPKHLLTALYSSEFDLYPEKYGYKVFEDPKGIHGYSWTSNLTSFEEVAALAYESMLAGKKQGNKLINGLESFWIAGLGFDLKYSLCKSEATFDWRSIDIQKIKRSKDYRTFIENKLDIDFKN